MNWKIFSTAAAFATMGIAAPPALADLWRAPYQIVHQASGLCAEKGHVHELALNASSLVLALCNDKNVLQKFHLIHPDTLTEVIPQIVTNSSPMVMIVGAWASPITEQLINGDIGGFSTVDVVRSPQLDRAARVSWYFDRIQPRAQYSNAYFKIRDTNEFAFEWEPNECTLTPGQSIVTGKWKSCSAELKIWRLQPTSEPANP